MTMAMSSKEYYAEIEKVYKKPEDYELAGKGNAYVRVDAEAKVTGRAKYTDDIDLPGMWYCKLVRSPHAHARIKSIDFTEALKVPGVKGVLTGKDFPEGHNMGNPEAFKELADKEPICREIVRMVGDEVAAVCGVTEEAAEEGMRLVKVEYEVLPAVIDPFEAMNNDAPYVHYKNTNNISMFTTMIGGDPDKAFAEADYTDKHYYMTQQMVHAAIEPHGAAAIYENGEWTIWSTTQGAYVTRFWIAWGLGVPESAVRVIKPHMGGGFGGKLDAFAHELCPAKFAQQLGHPVKCILKRDEVFLGTRTRHPIAFEIETAFTKDGKLLAKRCRHILDGGAYGGSGIAANALSLICATFPYKVDNIDMTARRPYTNKPASGAMRGYSACQVHFAHDVHIEEVAESLGIDSVELRRKNAITPYYTGPTGLQFTTCDFDETLVRAAEAIDWAKRGEIPRGSGTGVGFAGSGFMSGTGFPVLVTPRYSSSSTLVRLNREGYATVFSGANDIGQGCDTVMVMIVAEELGLRMDEVKIVNSDTTLTPWDAGSFGSRVTFLGGNSCRRAVGDAKLKLLTHWGEEWGCKPEDITMKDHRVFVKGDPEKNISYNEACFGYEEKNFGRCISGVGSFAHDGDKDIYVKNRGNYAPAYSFSSSAARVEVDMETGQIELKHFVFAHDCGRPLNTRAVEGQIEGSVLLGLGFTCYEECKYDKDGHHLNPSFRDYRFPTALDMPSIQTILCGKPDPDGPMGAKEAGEGSTAPVGPAIANALTYATGLKFHRLPVDPETIWRGIRQKKLTGAIDVGLEGLEEKFAKMPDVKPFH
ncbi:MAG: molybdopterin-dependent oxidoreductase [Deltaproteobacteria bacterium]|jgi:CO/xanthine dehydrogenase Mo-binding subunit|nr:molybdopterin-dependent oxidoreductase [Deltaproteobacteria bacterium]